MTASLIFLVTAASGDLAEAIGGVLRDAYPDAKLHGLDACDLGPASVVFDEVTKGPFAYEDGYCDFLADHYERIGARYVVPCLDRELLAISDHPNLLQRISVLMPQPGLIKTFSDKLDTVRWLEARGLPAPKTCLLTQAMGEQFPLVVKPRRGSGSTNIHIVRSQNMLECLIEEHGDEYVAQQYVGNEETEYTCPVLRYENEVRVLLLRRKLALGRTVQAVVERNPVVENMLKRLVEEADLEGPLNVQLRLDESGNPWIFEINPRFSSTVKMRHMLGFSDLKWLIQAKDGEKMTKSTPLTGAKVVRMSREVILS